MSAPVVVFSVGNPSRGDDAIGPLLAGRLEEWLDNEGLVEGFELIEDFQLQIEHALDLQGRELALFIDSGSGTAAPCTFRHVVASPGVAHSTHTLPPEAVLHVFRQTEGGEPPPAFVLCVRGEEFGLGQPLTAAARAHADAAWALLQNLCREATAAAWMRRAGR